MAELLRVGVVKTPFCNNPKCELHQYKVETHVDRLEVARPGIIIGSTSHKVTTRQLFQSADGTRRAFFCEICVSAIDTAQMAVGEAED